MTLQSQAIELLREYDVQTPVGQFAQNVLDYLEEQFNPYVRSGTCTLTKVSKNEGETITDYKYQGTFNHKPKVGQAFQFFYDNRVIRTSTVKEVNQIDEKTTELKTLNSTYMLSTS